MAFKVKVTTPKIYKARPNAGIIKPHSKCQIQVMRQAENAVPPSNVIAKEKFMVQRTFVHKSVDDVSSIFRGTKGGRFINETKLKVLLATKQIKMEMEEEDLEMKLSQDIAKMKSEIEKLALSLEKAEKTISQLREQKKSCTHSKVNMYIVFGEI